MIPAPFIVGVGREPFDVGDALRTVYLLYAKRFGKPRWGDKTPNCEAVAGELLRELGYE